MVPAVKLGLGAARGPWRQRAGMGGQMTLGTVPSRPSWPSRPGPCLWLLLLICYEVPGSSAGSTFPTKQR